MLTDYFSRKLEKADVRVAFFGDNYLSDIYASHAFNHRLRELDYPARWDPIAVLPELESLDSSYSRL